MCLNQGALSCSGTHFIKPSSWGRGSMHPHIYHTNPSGLSPFFTDSMCVIGSRPPDQTTHWLPTLIHFHFHLPFSVLRFLICALPLPPWVFLWCSLFFVPFIFVLHFSLCPFFLFCFPFLGGQMLPSSDGFWTLLFLLCLISLPHVSPISFSRWCERFRSFTTVKGEI